jgi:hypothetical protein
MPIEKMLVLSAGFGTLENGTTYASIIATTGGMPRSVKDSKDGFDSQKLRVNLDVAKALVAKRHLPCVCSVDYDLEGVKATPVVYGITSYPETREKVQKFFSNLFTVAGSGDAVTVAASPAR